jgi:hypothetical protein
MAQLHRDMGGVCNVPTKLSSRPEHDSSIVMRSGETCSFCNSLYPRPSLACSVPASSCLKGTASEPALSEAERVPQTANPQSLPLCRRPSREAKPKRLNIAVAFAIASPLQTRRPYNRTQRMRSLILLFTLALPAIAQSQNLHLSEESAGNNAIVQTLVSAFDQVDLVALGEGHGRFETESDLRIALVRSPDFAKKVRFIVVEFASITAQATLDRYIRGDNVPSAQLEQVWKTTTQAPNGVWDSPIYPAFFAAVRDVNAKLPSAQQIRILGGDPGPGDTRSREGAAADVIKEQVLQKHGKALLIWGAAHFYRALPDQVRAGMGGDIGLVNLLEPADPGRILSVIVVGHLDRPKPVAVDVVPNFQKIDGVLKSHVRPVLVSLQQPPLRDLSAEEFLGRTVTTCRPPGGCRSAFKGSTLKLGQMADAFLYYGGDDNIGHGRGR